MTAVQTRYVKLTTQGITPRYSKMFPDRCTPFPFQIEGTKFALERAGCIIGDEMGLGKTVQAIGVMNAIRPFPRVLVVCPSVSKYSWEMEIGTWRTYLMTTMVVEGRQPADFHTADIVIINYDILKNHLKELQGVTWDLIIADEFHYLRNIKSQRSKAFYSLIARKRMYLSGTPIPNKVKNIWAPLRSLSPSWGTYMEFTKRYCNGHFEWTGPYKEWNAEGASNLPELHEKLKPYMIRRKADQVLNLPDMITNVIRVEPDEDERELAAEIARLAKELLASGKAVDITKMKPTDMSAAKIHEYRRKAGQTKLPVAIEKIKEVIKKGEKIVVFAYHREITQAIHKAFPQSVMVIGGVPSLKKKEAADRFQNDPKCNVFVGNIESAGVTLTLTAACHMLFVEHDWRPDTVLQAAKRCHRIGQKRKVYLDFLVLDDSIDVNMAHSIDKKVRNMQVALDGVDPSWAELVFERKTNGNEEQCDEEV